MNLTDENIIEITDELSSEYEISKVLRQYPKDTVIVKNVKGFDMPDITTIATDQVLGQLDSGQVEETRGKIDDAVGQLLEPAV